jgi:AcrR family transcriptional regulator
MARRNEHSQEAIKDMVLHAAESIVIASGVEALTVRKVALDIGYTVGSIYMVFSNRQDLVLHIKGRTLDHLTEHLQTAIVQADVRLQIVELAVAYMQFAATNFNRWRILFEPGFHDDATLPDWYRQKVERLFAPIEALFCQLKPGYTPEQTRLAARTLWCGVHGVCILALHGSLGRAGIDHPEIAVRLLADNFIQGWRQ